jgi:hypothetical protein
MLEKFERVWAGYKAGEDLLLSEVSGYDLVMESEGDALKDVEDLVVGYMYDAKDKALSEFSAMDLLNWAAEKK